MSLGRDCFLFSFSVLGLWTLQSMDLTPNSHRVRLKLNFYSLQSIVRNNKPLCHLPGLVFSSLCWGRSTSRIKALCRISLTTPYLFKTQTSSLVSMLSDPSSILPGLFIPFSLWQLQNHFTSFQFLLYFWPLRFSKLYWELEVFI